MTARFHHAATPDGAGRPILPFIGLVFVESVPFWVAGAAAAEPSLGLPVDLPVSALMVVCPLGAGAALTYREDGAAPRGHRPTPSSSAAAVTGAVDRRRAWAAASVRLLKFSAARVLLTWCSTVRGLMTSRAAMSAFDRPSASSASTSR
jgi:hypothetical protein